MKKSILVVLIIAIGLFLAGFWVIQGRASAQNNFPSLQRSDAPAEDRLLPPSKGVLASTQYFSTTGVPFTVVDHDPNYVLISPPNNNLVRNVDGTLYAAYTLHTQQSTPWYNYIRWSNDDGQTWSNPVRTENFPDSNMVQNLAVDDQDYLYQGFSFNVGTFFNRSTDGGLTWSDAVPLHDGGWGDYDTRPSLIVTGTNQLAAVISVEYPWHTPPSNLVFKTSQDGGLTWSSRLDITHLPEGTPGDGAFYADIYQGLNGWLFVSYDDYSSIYPNHQHCLVYYDGQQWSEPIIVSEAFADAYQGDLAVDSTGLLHMAWGETNLDNGLRDLRYRTFDPATRNLSPIRTLSEINENIYNVSVGMYTGDQFVIAYDTFHLAGSYFSYGGVYVRNSSDDFATRVKVSTHPNAFMPNLRSSKSFMYQPEHQDLLWVEPNDLIGGQDLVYADLSDQAPPAHQALQANLYGPRVANPGQQAPYLIDYRNTLTYTIENAVLVAFLPPDFPYAGNIGGGQLKYDENAVIWKLGNLDPGAQGRVALYLSIPWGSPSQTITVIARLDADNAPLHLLNLPVYQAYDQNPVKQERYLSETEISTMLHDGASIQALHALALNRGFFFPGVGKEFVHEGGETTRTLIYIKETPFELGMLMQMGTVAYMIRQTDEVIEYFDTTGGLVININDGSYTGYGTWSTPPEGLNSNLDKFIQPYGPALSPAQSLPEQDGPNYDTCFRNCMMDNAAMALVNFPVDTLMVPVKGAWGALKGGWHTLTGQWDEVGKDALSAIPYENVSHRVVEAATCDLTCLENPSKYDCAQESGEVGKKWCASNNIRMVHYCSAMHMWQLNPQSFDCAYWTPATPYCRYGECVATYCDTSPLESNARLASVNLPVLPGPPAPADSPAAIRPCEEDIDNCKHDDTDIVPAHDPNAKSIQPEGDILPGELLTYTIEYENTGAGTAYDVFILDPIDANLDETTLQIPAGSYAADTRIASWYIGEVAPHAGGFVTFTVNVRTGLPSGTLIANQAEVHFPSAAEITPTDLVLSRVNTLVAEPQSLDISGPNPLPITLAGREASGAPVTYTLQTSPIYGYLTGAPPVVIYHALPNFSGQDEFNFIANHNGASSAPARVIIFVQPDPSDATPPAVLVTYPVNGAKHVRVPPEPINGDPPYRYLPLITVHFSEPILPDIQLYPGALTLSGDITGTLSYDAAAWTLSFIPSSPLPTASAITATLDSWYVRDLNGNFLPQPYVWSFTTSGLAFLQVTLPENSAELRFPTVALGHSSTALIITLTNLGQWYLDIGTIRKGGANPGDFIIQEDTCNGQFLFPMQSCTLQAIFTPAGFGIRSADLIIPSNDSLVPETVVVMSGPVISYSLYLPIVER